MHIVWDWLLYTIPWYVQAVILLVVVGVPILLVAFMVWGPKAVLRLILAVLGVILTLGLASRFRQSGYADRKRQEDEALDRANKTVDKERDEVRQMPDAQLDKEVDRWTRK